MKYYQLKGAVIGGLGDNSILDHSHIPARILHLHIEIDLWKGEEFCKCSPIHYVTDNLRDEILNSELSGIVGFKEVEISRTSDYEEIYGVTIFPKFHMLEIKGMKGKDDFFLDGIRLYSSEKALSFLQRFNLSGTEIIEI